VTLTRDSKDTSVVFRLVLASDSEEQLTPVQNSPLVIVFIIIVTSCGLAFVAVDLALSVWINVNEAYLFVIAHYRSVQLMKFSFVCFKWHLIQSAVQLMMHTLGAYE
jgi:hypothetical protein